ncbi:MAG: hypothetical protein Ct9H300mP24_3330 [Candidatus Neomarinimicrobiota bacterium]|nr:MAG: hypothetical protein Ct9H300mP24_3330 [Candidatus Neomarinimicrobiota bacterium]
MGKKGGKTEVGRMVKNGQKKYSGSYGNKIGAETQNWEKGNLVLMDN